MSRNFVLIERTSDHLNDDTADGHSNGNDFSIL